MILRFVCAPCALILHPFTPKAHTESAHGFNGKTVQQIGADCNENSPYPDMHYGGSMNGQRRESLSMDAVTTPSPWSSESPTS